MNRLRRAFTITLAFAIVLVGGLVAAQTPAQAESVSVVAAQAPAPVMSAALAPTCPATKICLFDASNWQGYKFVADPWSLPANTCFNMDIFWNNNVDSFWYNEESPFWYGSYAELYEGVNCTVDVIARAMASTVPLDSMRSCNEYAYWDGPCGPPNNVTQRASSWAFDLN